MPRRARIIHDNSTVLLTQRGNNRSSCFFANEDYAFYIDMLVRACNIHSVALHAYVLMPSEVHLLLSSTDGQAPSHMMKQVSQRYVQYINRTYQRSGTLWEGRYRSCIVGEGDYVLGCYRYVEQAPVRDGAANRPADYHWSSHQANAGEEPSSMLVRHPFLQSGDYDAYRDSLVQPLDKSLEEEIRSAVNGNLVLGSEIYQRQIGDALNTRTWRGKAGRPRKIAPG